MSKFTLFIAAAERGLMWAAVIAVFTGLLTVACFVRAAYKIFWGEIAPNSEIDRRRGGRGPADDVGSDGGDRRA